MDILSNFPVWVIISLKEVITKEALEGLEGSEALKDSFITLNYQDEKTGKFMGRPRMRTYLNFDPADEEAYTAKVEARKPGETPPIELEKYELKVIPRAQLETQRPWYEIRVTEKIKSDTGFVRMVCGIDGGRMDPEKESKNNPEMYLRLKFCGVVYADTRRKTFTVQTYKIIGLDNGRKDKETGKIVRDKMDPRGNVVLLKMVRHIPMPPGLTIRFIVKSQANAPVPELDKVSGQLSAVVDRFSDDVADFLTPFIPAMGVAYRRACGLVEDQIPNRIKTSSAPPPAKESAPPPPQIESGTEVPRVPDLGTEETESPATGKPAKKKPAAKKKAAAKKAAPPPLTGTGGKKGK